MKNEPLISVVMPAYNASALITESIKSLLQQSYTNWELLIVDDGSTDNTVSFIKEFAKQDNRIKYFYQQNGKQGKARNKGIKEATGSIIAFIDADDTWTKKKLEKQVIFLQSTNADLVFANVTVVDENGATHIDSWGVEDATYSGDEGLLAFMNQNKAPLLSVMAKKESILSVNGFNETTDMQYVEDYDLWLRMLQQGAKFASSSEKLACYRLDTQKTSARKKTLINVVNTLKGISLHDNSLQQKKNIAMTLWTRRIVKRCAPAIDKEDMKKIISLFPSPIIRSLFSTLNNLFGAALVSKVILMFTRSLTLKQVSL